MAAAAVPFTKLIIAGAGKALPVVGKTLGLALLGGVAAQHGQRLASVYGIGEDAVDAFAKIAGLKKKSDPAPGVGATAAPPALIAPPALVAAPALIAPPVAQAQAPVAATGSASAPEQVVDVGCGCTANDTPDDLRAALNTVLGIYAEDAGVDEPLPDANKMPVGSWLDDARAAVEKAKRKDAWHRGAKFGRRQDRDAVRKSREVLDRFKDRAHDRIQALQAQLRDARDDAAKASLQAQVDALKAQQAGAGALDVQLQTSDPRALQLAQQIAQFESQPALFDTKFQAMAAQPSFIQQLKDFKEAASLISPPVAPQAPVVVIPSQQPMQQQPVVLMPQQPQFVPQFGAPMDPGMGMPMMDPGMMGLPFDPSGMDMNMVNMAVPPDMGVMGVSETTDTIQTGKACAINDAPAGPLAALGIADPDAIDVLAIANQSGGEIDCGCA